MAKFTVLGASGFIGSHLVRNLRTHSHEVLAPDRSDLATLRGNLGYVIFCVGITVEFWKRPLETAHAHVCALNNVLKRAEFDRLVYLSSVRLYDGVDCTGDETDVFRLDPFKPRHVYDLSKCLGEALIYHGGRAGVVARIANVYDDTLSRDDFLCRTVAEALAKQEITINSNPHAGRDYIHVDDVVRALEAIALSPVEAVYNVATGTIFSNQDLAALLEQNLECRISFRSREAAGIVPAPHIVRLTRDFGLHPIQPSARLPAILKAVRQRR
jgi:UDP-glucose 4-epimerase